MLRDSFFMKTLHQVGIFVCILALRTFGVLPGSITYLNALGRFSHTHTHIHTHTHTSYILLQRL